jgi:spore germination protein
MRIEVVRPGETIWNIARRYGLTVEQVAEANGLSDPNRLVVGQALVIPVSGDTHLVAPGETLWMIAVRYGVSVEQLMQLNGIVNPNELQVGTVLQLPRPPKRAILVNAYLQVTTPEKDLPIIRETAPYLTYFSFFQYRTLATGELVGMNDGQQLEAVRQTAAAPMMVVSNFADGNFSPDIARAVFTDPQARSRLIGEIVETMRTKGFRAVNLDFENLGLENRDPYTAFVRDLAPAVRQAGGLLSTALAPKTSSGQAGTWYEGHDYGAHGTLADFVILMTYEWGWSGGPPMAVSPIPQMRAVLDYAVTVIPRNKIVMGAPLYGYDWTLPYVAGGEFARALSPQAAVEQAARVNAAIQYDPVAQAPYYRYWDAEGREHVVWFEDARSMQAKFDLINAYGLSGISYWVLGNAFPQNWMLLADNFDIRRA